MGWMWFLVVRGPPLATGVFRAATGVAAAPQRGANPPFATGVGSGEAPLHDAKIHNNLLPSKYRASWLVKIC